MDRKDIENLWKMYSINCIEIVVFNKIIMEVKNLQINDIKDCHK